MSIREKIEGTWLKLKSDADAEALLSLPSLLFYSPVLSWGWKKDLTELLYLTSFKVPLSIFCLKVRQWILCSSKTSQIKNKTHTPWDAVYTSVHPSIPRNLCEVVNGWHSYIWGFSQKLEHFLPCKNVAVSLGRSYSFWDVYKKNHIITNTVESLTHLS